MPNRILKESICSSEKLSRLTDFQFRVWASLVVYVDDYGRGDARPAIIKGTCFPLRDRITNKDIDDALHALAGAGCISLYTVDGKPYLCFPSWAEHQRIQTKKSKFPVPPSSTVSHRESPPESNPIQSNPIRIQSESESESESELRAPARVSGELEEELKKFAAMRREMGKPMTEVEKAEVMKLLDENKADAVEMVRQSLQKGWLHIYPLKNKGRKKESWEAETSYDLGKAMDEQSYNVPGLKRKE